MRASFLLSAVLIGTLPMVGASLIHDYQFQDTLADSLGGPSLTSLGGVLGAGDYTFGAQQGLSLSNAFSGSQDADYSIYLNFEFDDLDGYRKILDFKNLASDNGLYNLSTDINYFNFSFSPNGVFTPGTFAQVVLTRDNSTGLVVGYVNGVQEISFTDTTSDAVFNASNNIINFFQDDSVTGGRESSSGVVSEIRIYDGAFSGPEVAGLAAVPEPAPLVSAGAGLAFFLLGWRWMQRRSKVSHFAR
jgi:hypothetical protein